MQIDSLVVGPIQAAAWLVWDEESGSGILIDPGDEPVRLAEWAKSKGVQIELLVGTHAHLDHVGAAAALKDLLKVPFAMHPADLPVLEGMPEMARQFGLPACVPARVDLELEDGGTVKAGGLELTVVHTPGHSPGSVSLMAPGHMFGGDLVFAGSIGRSDLPGGSMEVLLKSIREQVLNLPDDTIIHPGHGPDTTVGRERQSNPFF